MEGSRQVQPVIGLRISVHNEVDGLTTDLLFHQFPVRIGRNPMNDLVLNHPYVSQWHALISVNGDSVSLTQVGSSNSVQVGEIKLQPSQEVALQSGERFRIPPFQLQVVPFALPGALPKSGTGNYESVIAAASGGHPDQDLAAVALKAFDRLSTRFVGAPLQTPAEIGAFAARLQSTLTVFFKFFVALQKGQEQFRQALDIRALKSGVASPVESASDGIELASYVLGTPDKTAIVSLESAAKNIMLHQLALINGMMAGVRSLLARLSPKAVAKEAAREHRSPKHRELWETYEQMHRDLSEEDDETFETIFGPQFGKAYTNLVGKKAGEQR